MHLKLYYYYDYLYHFFHIPCSCSFIDKLKKLKEHGIPKNSCSSMIHQIVKKAVKEFNKKSSNSCYYYPACIIGVYKYYPVSAPNIFTIYVTLGFTTIKKSKIKQKWVKFPSYFEGDKSLRMDVLIEYKFPYTCYTGTDYPEELLLDSVYHDNCDGNKRLINFPDMYHRNRAPLVTTNLLL